MTDRLHGVLSHEIGSKLPLPYISAMAFTLIFSETQRAQMTSGLTILSYSLFYLTYPKVSLTPQSRHTPFSCSAFHDAM